MKIHSHIKLIPPLNDALTAYPEYIDERKDGYTPLLAAIKNGYADSVKMLLNKGAYPYYTSDDGYSIWHAAAFSKEPTLIDILCAIPSAPHLDVRCVCGPHKGFTALHLAITLDNTILVEALLNAGANPHLLVSNPDPNVPGKSIWHIAAQSGAVQAILVLLTKLGTPEDLTWIDLPTSLPLLYCAVEKGNADVVKRLLDLGANRNMLVMKNNSYLNIWHMAVLSGDSATLSLLCSYKNMPSLEDICQEGKHAGLNPLQLAICKRDKPNQIEQLLQAGANPTCNVSPLHKILEGMDIWELAARYAHTHILDFFIERFNPTPLECQHWLEKTFADLDKSCPRLFQAIAANNATLVRKLLTLGADGFCTFQNLDVWQFAAKHEADAVIAELAHFKAQLPSINATAKEGRQGFSPLFHTKDNDDPETFIELLKAGADINAVIENDENYVDGTNILQCMAININSVIIAALGEYYPEAFQSLDQPCLIGGYKGYTPLHIAIVKEFDYAIKALLKYGANTNVIVDDPEDAYDGMNIWQFISVTLNPFHSKAILILNKNKNDRTPSIDAVCTKGKYKSLSPLMIAIGKNNKSMVIDLLEAGASTTLRINNPESPSPIHNMDIWQWGVYRGAYDAVSALLEHLKPSSLECATWIDSYSTKKPGLTLLHLAVLDGDIDAIKQLVSFKANTNVIVQSLPFDHANSNYEGMNICHLASFSPKHNRNTLIPLFQGIMEKAELNKLVRECISRHKIYAGCTPLHIAVTKDNGVFIEQLIQIGANPNQLVQNITKFAGMSPLHIAVQLGNLPSIKALVDVAITSPTLLNINLGSQNPGCKDFPALFYASFLGNDQAVTLLLKAGANGNFLLKENRPPQQTEYGFLHLAMGNLHPWVIKAAISECTEHNSFLESGFSLLLNSYNQASSYKKSLAQANYQDKTDVSIANMEIATNKLVLLEKCIDYLLLGGINVLKAPENLQNELKNRQIQLYKKTLSGLLNSLVNISFRVGIFISMEIIQLLIQYCAKAMGIKQKEIYYSVDGKMGKYLINAVINDVTCQQQNNINLIKNIVLLVINKFRFNELPKKITFDQLAFFVAKKQRPNVKNYLDVLQSLLKNAYEVVQSAQAFLQPQRQGLIEDLSKVSVELYKDKEFCMQTEQKILEIFNLYSDKKINITHYLAHQYRVPHCDPAQICDYLIHFFMEELVKSRPFKIITPEFRVYLKSILALEINTGNAELIAYINDNKNVTSLVRSLVNLTQPSENNFNIDSIKQVIFSFTNSSQQRNEEEYNPSKRQKISL